MNWIIFFGFLLIFAIFYESTLETWPSLSPGLLARIGVFAVFSGIIWAVWEYIEQAIAFIKVNWTKQRNTGMCLRVDGKEFKICYTKKDDLCVMCLDHLTEDRVVNLPICRHKFHIQCFMRWYNVRKACPTCIRPI